MRILRKQVCRNEAGLDAWGELVHSTLIMFLLDRKRRSVCVVVCGFLGFGREGAGEGAEEVEV